MQTNYKLILCSIPEEKEEELRKIIPDFSCFNVKPYQNTVIHSIVQKAVKDENMDFIEQLLKNNFIKKRYKTSILSAIAEKEFFFPLVERMLQEEDWEQDKLTSILSSISLSYSPSAKIALIKKGAFNFKKNNSYYQEYLLRTAATKEFNIELVKYILEYALKYDKLDVFRYAASESFYIIIETFSFAWISQELLQKKLAILKMLLAVYGNSLFFSKPGYKEHDCRLRSDLLDFLSLTEGIVPLGIIGDECDNILIRWANGEFDK